MRVESAGPGESLAADGPKFPLARASWSGSVLEPDWLATGDLPLEPVARRRYERPTTGEAPAVVDLFVAYHDPSRPWASPFSSRLIRPGPEWWVMEQDRVHIWPLELTANHARVRSGSAQAIVYHWNLRDDGWFRSDVRWLLGLERHGTTLGQRRAVVRLTTPLDAVGPVARDRAKRLLDRFIGDFAEDLERL